MGLRKIKENLRRFRDEAAVLGGDVFKYRRLKRCPVGHRAQLKIRPLGDGVITARSRTTDIGVVMDCFHGLYHLPPEPLSAGATVLDLGANVGYTMRHFKYLYPDARIIGVEMDAENCEMCRENTRELSDCEVLNAAVAAESGTVEYAVDTHEDAFHIFGTRHADTPRSGTLRTVDAVTIPDIIAQFGIDRIDYIKMDIEGAEESVFQADASWLDRTRMLNIEVHEADYFDGIFALLNSRGFSTWRDDRHWSAIMAVRR
jgi:FkbM family methyltransferase